MLCSTGPWDMPQLWISRVMGWIFRILWSRKEVISCQSTGTPLNTLFSLPGVLGRNTTLPDSAPTGNVIFARTPGSIPMFRVASLPSSVRKV